MGRSRSRSGPNVPDWKIALSTKCLRRVVATNQDGRELLQCEFSAAMGRYCTFTEGIENRADLRELTFHPRPGYRLQNIPAPPNSIQFLEQRENQAEDEVEADTDGGGD